MIVEKLSARVLTIGCQWKKPKGGIAVVLNSYSRIFPKFNIIVNSNGKNAIANLLQLLYSLVVTTFKLTFCRSIKIVHIHTASYNSFKRSALFISLAKFFKRKVVIHIHSVMPNAEEYISRYSIRETVIKYRNKYLEMQK